MQTNISNDFIEKWKSFTHNSSVSFDEFAIAPQSFFPIDTKLCLREFNAHYNFIGGLWVTQTQIISSSEDGYTRIFDKTNLENSQSFYDYATNYVAVSHCGNYLFSGDDGYKVKIYQKNIENNNWNQLYVLEGHQNYVNKLAFTENKLISGDKDGKIKIWDFRKGTLLQTIEAHNNWIYGLAVSPDGKKLISSALDSTLKVWDLENYTLLFELVKGSSLVYVMGLTVGGNNSSGLGNKEAPNDIIWLTNDKVATNSNDIVIWDTNTWKVLFHIDSGNKYKIKRSAFVPQYNMLITTGDVIEGWDIDTGKIIFSEVGHQGKEIYSCFAFENQLYTGDKDGNIKEWNIDNLVREGVKLQHSDNVYNIFYDENTNQILSSAYDNSILIYNHDATPIEKIKTKGAAKFLGTMPHKSHQIIISWQGYLAIYDTLQQKIIQKIQIDHSNLIEFDKCVFLNDTKALFFSLCYAVRLIDFQTQHITILETAHSLNDIIFLNDKTAITRTYPMRCLDDKEIFIKNEHNTWKSLIDEKKSQKIQKNKYEEIKESPLLLLDIQNFEIKKEIKLPKEMAINYTGKYYALKFHLLNPNILLVVLSNYQVIIWDIEQSQVIQKIEINEEYIAESFVYEDCFYLVGSSGGCYVYNKNNFEIEKMAFLDEKPKAFYIDEEKGLLFYTNENQYNICAFDLKTKKIKFKQEIGFQVVSSFVKNDILLIGGEQGNIFSFKLIK